MVNSNDAPADDLLTLVTQLFRSLSKPTIPISEPLQQAAPMLFARYTKEYPAQSSYEIAHRVLTDMIAQIANQWPGYAEIFGLLLEGEPISALARTAPMRWSWSESTFYNRYRAARECFVEHLQEAEKQARRQQADNRALPVDSVPLSAPMVGEAPFKGLQFFDVADASRFYGRERLVQELMQALQRDRFLAIVGASGSGKSSLARAGLVASLIGAPDLTVYLMTPTIDPLRSLAFHLMAGTRDITKLLAMRDGLLRDTRYLDYYLADLAMQSGAGTERFLLVIDQFEELFTLCTDPAVRRAFVENVMMAFTNSRTVWVVFTLRADFYAHCAEYEELRTALSKFQHYIGPMSSAELRRAIEEPAYQGGWNFESALVDLLLQDVGQEPAALPLLSHALLETWKRREGRMLTVRGYVASGRVQGAIAQTADEIFQQTLLAEQRTIARNIFLRLTELGEGVPDTRRRVAIAELISTPAAESVVADVLQILTAARLVTTYQDEAEVAHEALIRQWPLLQTWLQEERDDLLIHRRMTDAAYDWIASARDGDLLYRGARLEQALEWARRYPQTVNTVEREYLTASEQAVVSARNQAELRVRVARAGQLAALSQVVAQDRAARASTLPLMLAKAAVETTWLADGEVVTAPFVTVEADAALQLAVDHASPWLMTLPRHRHTDKITSVDFSPNGDLLATCSHDETIRLWSMANGEQAQVLIGHANHVMSVRFSHDGTKLVSASKDASARIWDVQTGIQLQILCGHTSGISHAVFSTDDRYIATSSRDQTARLWDVHTGKELCCYQHDNELKTVALHPHASQLCTGCDDRIIRLWDLNTGQECLRLVGHSGSIYSVEYNSDGTKLISTSWDGTARLWSVESGEELLRLRHDCPVFEARISPDQQYLVTACRDRYAVIWHLSTTREIGRLVGHRDRVRAISFSVDSTLCATVSNDQSIRLWSVPTLQYRPILQGHVDAITALHAHGNWFLSAGADGALRLWNIYSGQQHTAWRAHTHHVTALVADAMGELAFSGGTDRIARLWSISEQKLLREFIGHEDAITSVALDDELQLVVTGSLDGTCCVWNIVDGQLKNRWQIHSIPVVAIAFCKLLRAVVVANTDGTIGLWAIATGKLLRQLHIVGTITAMSISRHDELLAVTDDNGFIYLFDLKEELLLWSHQFVTTALCTVAFSPDSHLLLVGGAGGHAQLIDRFTSQTHMTLEGHIASVGAATFSHDGERLLTADSDGTIHSWHAVPQQQTIVLRDHYDWVTAAAFSPNQQLAASTGMDGSIILYSTTDYRIIRRLYGHTDRIHSIAFDHSGTRLVSASKDKSVRIWSVSDGVELLCLCGHRESVKSAVFSPDDTLIATGSNDMTVRVWNVESGQTSQIYSGHQADVSCVKFSPDGQQLVSTAHDKSIRLWDVLTGNEVGLFTGHTGNICSVDFSPDGAHIVTASDDETARLWDLNSGKELISYGQHADIVWSVTFDPTGNLIATASKDGAVRIWEVATGRCLRVLSGHNDEVLTVAFSPDGNYIISASKDKSAIVWTVSIASLLKTAESRIQRDPAIFTRDERLRFGLDAE